jgi:hypothetical protein
VAITTTPSGGPQGEFSTYTPVYSQTLSSTAPSVIFSNIPQEYTDLQVVCQTIASGSALNLTININGDAASNYGITSLYGRSEGAGTGVSSIRASNATYALANYGTATTTDVRSISRIDVLNYSNNTTFKTIICRAATAPGNSTFSGNELIANLWRSTVPITSITLGGGTFAAGSTFTLYGIKAAATQFVPTKAFGGDTVVSDGTYAYHVFRTSGRFVPYSALSCDYLVVAGGGGAGSTAGGGGGAGGLRAFMSQSISTSQTVTIGSGGAGGAGSYNTAASGSSTSFGSSSVSGGGGGGGDAGAGANGGSGGGGGGSSISRTTGGTGNSGGYSPSEGYGGGQNHSSYETAPYAAGGGGGAGGAGQTAPATNQGGYGGVGVSVYNSVDFSSWLTATGLGSDGKLAGGGGGATYNSGTSGAGGSGGGGKGGVGATGSYGVVNTGGGAGGGGISSVGGSGGSGLVIVRYAL